MTTMMRCSIAATLLLVALGPACGSGPAKSGGPGGAGMGAAGTTGAAGTVGTAGSTGAAGTGTAGGAGTSGGAGATGAAGTTGAAGVTGAAGTTGAAGAMGGAGTTGAAGTTGGGGRDGGAAGGGAGTGGNPDGGATDAALPRFSFFVTSLEAMRALSGSQDGFGGDLRHGETTGLAGADKICREIAERGLAGAGAKTWRAFLSATKGGDNGGPVNAIDRIGTGPWYDRLGRLVAMTKADLQQTRPRGADAVIINDLPNETGTPNHGTVDNHDTVTGSTSMGMLMSTNMSSTCNDWTSAVGNTGKPMLGHSWPAGSGMSWLQAHAAAGCAPNVTLTQMGGPPAGSTGIGAGGGYGGFYCFALTP
jgi:hypothetical protein